MASLLGRLTRGAVKVAGKVASPVLKTVGKGVLRQIPGIGLGIAAVEGFQAARSAFAGGGGGGGGLPALPALPGGQMTMAARAGVGPGDMGMMQAAAMQQAVTGRKGTGSMPPLTMEMIQQLEAAGLMIGFKDLRVSHRSPMKGFVVVHPNGSTFALRKDVARKWGLWKPASKPPISAGEMNAIRKANAVVKKFTRIGKEIRSVANFGSRRGPPRLQVIEAPGRKLIGRKAA